jgi:GT2 family glycosyltransferase
MLKIFVVILNWNRYKDTVECLQSLEKLTIRNYQLSVLVVDNGSTDGSVKEIDAPLRRGFAGRGSIIKNKKNLGFAGGNNVGIKYALENGADYILVLNNDTLVDKNLLVYLIKAAKSHKKAGILSPIIYFSKGYEFHKDRYKKDELGRVIWYAGGVIDWNNVYASNRGVDEVDNGQYDKRIKLEFATGACMFLRASALKKTGLFDEKYFLYLEDADLSQRMLIKDWEVWYVPEAKLWHKVAQSSAIGSDLNDYYITRNRLLFAIRYAPPYAKLAVIRESFRFALNGRKWQKIGARDFYLRKFGKGSWK